MLLTILIILNIPIFLFLGWVIFDTEEFKSENLWETFVGIMIVILIPKILRGDDSDAFGNIVMILAFLGGCVAAVWGEYHLINKWFFGR